MDGSDPGRLAGSEIHGFHTMEDLDVRTTMNEATTRWLRPNEIHAILYNHSYFNIHVKPVSLPPSGTIVLFDRKMLRNFRKDGHNWKKKKDGKTVKEAHEHLKVGDEERIHVYYAHGQDNPNFVRRCYWLLDKKQEHIVLVHYRETSELQGSPATPVNSNSSSGNSDPYASRVLSEEIDSGIDPAFYAGSVSSLVGESAEPGDSVTVRNHEMRLHEINTLEWEDLLATQVPNDLAGPKRDEVSHFEQHNLYEMSNSKSNDTLLPTDDLPAAGSVSVDVRLPTSDYFQTIGVSDQIKDSEEPRRGKDESLGVSIEGLQTQDSFGRWMNCIITDSSESIDDPPLESPISSGHESNLSAVMDYNQPSIEEQVFSIAEVSPAWAYSTEETKVNVIGCFSREASHLAQSGLVCVFGDVCVPAEMVQFGVFRCVALPHNPGPVNLYLSFDGCTPISQVLSFEYRSPINDQVAQPKDEWEKFQQQLRLAQLLFSTTNCLSFLSSKVSANSLRDAKRFAHVISNIDKGWEHLTKSVGNGISLPLAKNSLLELSLKNKFLEWLLERVVEGCKTPARDDQGQGVIHLCAILGYTWAVKPYSYSGLSLDFRDASGWTALHWAAYHGRKEMVAVLLSAGAKPNLVSDPTPEFPGGRTAADLASKNGHDGLAAYLAEKGLIAQLNAMHLSGNLSGSLETSFTNLVNPINLSEDELCLKDTLAAYRTAADAAARIQSAYRENSLKLRTKAVQLSNPENEARTIVAAMRIQHAFRHHEMRKKMAAAARIQYGFRTWKIRKEFLNLRKQAIKIQAAFRGFQVRKQYHKIIWSVGILEKALLRWRHKRRGFRGLQIQGTEAAGVNQSQDSDGEEDFFRISRKQAEERMQRSVVRVQALFRSKQAQLEYRKMKLAHNQAALEYEGAS
ncbi:calmodulin-binding transcription activator 5-like [Macadamia integrifolia]|uniref:calmodulin-binding transcription activator 5-like n=1 Tax=Macadamia integrifolia TaxID=60698 RepID=UPI001C52F442|nr:calmodulin-binding transcription activator 5-like [Macadamia integrifolia]XP_042476262.1 calmodulin-binding transcription activator 5-like [Macadamia integrifolia]